LVDDVEEVGRMGFTLRANVALSAEW
jgi:hypothetical protein